MHIKKAPLRKQWSLDDSFAVLLDGLVPWQDLVEVLWMSLSALYERVGCQSFSTPALAGRAVWTAGTLVLDDFEPFLL